MTAAAEEENEERGEVCDYILLGKAHESSFPLLLPFLLIEMNPFYLSPVGVAVRRACVITVIQPPSPPPSPRAMFPC